MRAGEREDVIHRRGLAENVDGHNGLGARRDFARGVGEIERVEIGMAVDEDGLRAEVGGGGRGGEPGVGGDEDFVAGADAEGRQRHFERIAAAVGAVDDMRGAGVVWQSGRSKVRTSSPRMKAPRSRTLSIAGPISGLRTRYCARKSSERGLSQEGRYKRESRVDAMRRFGNGA